MLFLSCFSLLALLFMNTTISSLAAWTLLVLLLATHQNHLHRSIAMKGGGSQSMLVGPQSQIVIQVLGRSKNKHPSLTV